MSRYTHLHLHTEYSLLDGISKIKDIAKQVKDFEMDSIAITDHGNMFGAIDFYQTMKGNGLKPIIGIEMYIYDGEFEEKNKNFFPISLYAKNLIGYKNLMYLSSQSFLNFYHKPRITKKMLRDNSNGIICTSSSIEGEIAWHLNPESRKNNIGSEGYEKSKEVALEYKEIFGDDFYIEIMRHGVYFQQNIDNNLIKLSKDIQTKLVATNDSHYTKIEDSQTQEIAMCMRNGVEWENPRRKQNTVSQLYLKSKEEMIEIFADIPEAIESTNEIADKCNLDLKLGNPTPPNFKFTRKYSEESSLILPKEKEFDKENNEILFVENDAVLFEHKCKEGLEERLKIVSKEKHDEYKNRLDHEIKIINHMKFPGYMLIVWDFVRESEKQDIPIGPGRGSAAGSLVAFSLRITDIDPMKYDLLFERFLNPERISMPDIDMDFAQNRRKDIIHYVQNSYGKENVAQVITFNAMMAKSVVRDVARVFEIPYKESNDFAKLIPNEIGITLEKALTLEPKIADMINSDIRFKTLWKHSLALEGLKKNVGVHAAGLVISNEALWKKTPIYVSNKDEEKNFVTQYSLNYLEDVDLIKFDFLGLKTLDVIYGAKKLIKIHKDIEIDWHNIDVNDKKVYEVMSTGKTVGMFQVESAGMQDLNRRMKPSNFEDVIALIALYRPGPMNAGMLDDFVNRKHNRQKISYPFEETEFPEQLKEILDPTYGVIVYQEQVMQIVQKIGGFSLGKSDLVRRAMGKKKIDVMKEYKSEFADGAENQGLNRKIAEDLFDLIEEFAGYGFNKSHSAAYAMITFQTAYLKTYYPAEFLAALLSTENDNLNKIALYVNEAKSLGVGIIAPDIQESEREFSVIKVNGKDNILFGLAGIKGVGSAAIDSIVFARKNGKFIDFSDFLNRVTTKVNKKILESLTQSGAFNNLKIGTSSYNRRTILKGIDKILDFSKDVAQIKKISSGGLFDSDDEFAKNRKKLILKPLADFSLKEILKLEKESMNFYISGHPLDEYKSEINKIRNLSKIKSINEFNNWQEVIFVVIIEIVEIKVSKKGNRFAIVKLLDETGEYQTNFFTKTLEQFEDLSEDLKDGAVGIKCQIKVEDENTRSMFIKEFFHINNANKKSSNLKQGNKAQKRVVEKVLEFENITQDEIIIPEIIQNCYIKFDALLSREDIFQIFSLAKNCTPKENKLFIVISTIEDSFTIDTGLKVNKTLKQKLSKSIKFKS